MSQSRVFRRSPKGFTLIEIVAVLTIIAILSSIAIVSYRGVQRKAEAARIATQLHYIEDAVIEAIISGARVNQFALIDVGNVDQSVLADYVTSANFSDLPPGFAISLRAQLAGDGSNQQEFLVVITVEAGDGDTGILAELNAMFPPHTAQYLVNEEWLAVDSRSLSMAPDSVF
jgi:prepilin-type N-terminal cleavage/methylation domain-containing protein